jgi:hypothetical protein
LKKRGLIYLFLFNELSFLFLENGRTNESILQELTEKHKQRLADEKSKFQDLTAILDDYKVLIHKKKFFFF